MAYVKFTWKNKGVGTETPLDETNLNHLEEGIKGEEERALTAEGERLKKAENLKDLASASTARTNLGLGTAATSASTAFDAAGAAATAQAEAAGAGFGFGQAATWPPRKPASGDAVTAIGMMLGGGVTLFDEAPAESLHWQRIVFPYAFTVTGLKVYVASAATERTLNLGLYDESGKLLHSAAVKIPANGSGLYGVEIPTTAVEPGKVYWTGIGCVNVTKLLALNLGSKELHVLIAGALEAKGELCLYQEPVAGGVLPATIPFSSINNNGSLYGTIVRVEGTA